MDDHAHFCCEGGADMSTMQVRDFFSELVEERLQICTRTLQIKGAEYGTTDRLHNFKMAAAIQGVEPETGVFLGCGRSISCLSSI